MQVTVDCLSAARELSTEWQHRYLRDDTAVRSVQYASDIGQ